LFRIETSGRAVVKTVMNNGTVRNAENFLTSWELSASQGLCSTEVVVEASVQAIVGRLTVAGAME